MEVRLGWAMYDVGDNGLPAEVTNEEQEACGSALLAVPLLGIATITAGIIIIIIIIIIMITVTAPTITIIVVINRSSSPDVTIIGYRLHFHHVPQHLHHHHPGRDNHHHCHTVGYKLTLSCTPFVQR